jgi:hypothetical protein
MDTVSLLLDYDCCSRTRFKYSARDFRRTARPSRPTWHRNLQETTFSCNDTERREHVDATKVRTNVTATVRAIFTHLYSSCWPLDGDISGLYYHVSNKHIRRALIRCSYLRSFHVTDIRHQFGLSTSTKTTGATPYYIFLKEKWRRTF